ncbi:MAG TPA: hypothetical protein VLE70_02775 [Anaerolineae bacterium]|nr:hypothetical protein [Anaerolineae bacterium]
MGNHHRSLQRLLAHGSLFRPTPTELIGTTGNLTYADSGALAAPANYYYLVTSVSSAGNEALGSNRVGKFSIGAVPGWNLLAWPILPAGTTLDEVLGEQLHGASSPSTADHVLSWTAGTQAYDSAWYCVGSACGSWDNHWLAEDFSLTDIVLEPGHGFWYQNRHDSFVWLNLGND